MATNPKNYLKHISLDCVVFGFHDNQLKVLLRQTIQTKEWALPGGFVKYNESLEEAASRVLKERTGVDNIFLQQFHVFSKPGRNKANPFLSDMELEENKKTIKWFDRHFISVGFYALVDFLKVAPMPDSNSITCDWKPIIEVKTLIIDHLEILNKALDTLRLQLRYRPIGLKLMPKKFTMPELQKLYETILGEKLDRRNFQRKILSYKILNKLDERKTGHAYKSPYLYEFNIENYKKALDNGVKGTW